MQKNEQKTLNEIKKLAQKGQHQAAKIMSKTLVQQRAQYNQYLNMAAQVKSMSMQITSMQTQQAIMGTLQGSTQVMSQISESMDMQQTREVLKQFSKQMMIAEGKADTVNDMFDMIEDPSTAVEADDAYKQVLGEMALKLEGDMVVENKKLDVKQPEEQQANDDIEARLAALRMA